MNPFTFQPKSTFLNKWKPQNLQFDRKKRRRIEPCLFLLYSLRSHWKCISVIQGEYCVENIFILCIFCLFLVIKTCPCYIKMKIWPLNNESFQVVFCLYDSKPDHKMMGVSWPTSADSVFVSQNLLRITEKEKKCLFVWHILCGWLACKK